MLESVGAPVYFSVTPVKAAAVYALVVPAVPPVHLAALAERSA